MNRHWGWVIGLSAVASCAAFVWAADPASDKRPDEAAVERARKKVQMLDEVYKNAVVLITDKYVNKETDFPAGSAAVALFKNVSKSGHQQVRLIDATGSPYEPANVAKADFEKEGIQKLKAGAASFDQVALNDKGKYELRAVTPVPVVMQKCVMCHAHYEAAKKKGEIVGAISYVVPIE